MRLELASFDRLARLAFEHQTRCGPMDRHSQTLLWLPLREGGFGWRRADTQPSVGFLASRLRSIDSLSDLSAGWSAYSRRTSDRLAHVRAGDDEHDADARAGLSASELALRTAHILI